MGCEETKCDWKCRKPGLCPKPKCELACEKTACDAKSSSSCCSCNKEANVKAAIGRADAASLIETDEMRPSLLEAFSTMLHKHQSGAEAQCCPCSQDAENFE